jgi:hypothetical protein
MAEIEDFLEGFNQPTYRGTRVNGVRVATWSSQHGWSGHSRARGGSGSLTAASIPLLTKRYTVLTHRRSIDHPL